MRPQRPCINQGDKPLARPGFVRTRSEAREDVGLSIGDRGRKTELATQGSG